MGGVPVEVTDAKISKCNSCGETSVNAKELKRWDRLRSEGNVPTPAEVKRIRESQDLSVSDFARLVGVTRQTIYAWEREDVAALQLSPASLLVGLMADELNGNINGVIQHLVDKAATRGQEIQITPLGPKQDAPRQSTCRQTRPKAACFFVLLNGDTKSFQKRG